MFAALGPLVRWDRPPPGTLRRGVVALYSAPTLYVVLGLAAAIALVALAVRARRR